MEFTVQQNHCLLALNTLLLTPWPCADRAAEPDLAEIALSQSAAASAVRGHYCTKQQQVEWISYHEQGRRGLVSYTRIITGQRIITKGNHETQHRSLFQNE